MGQLMVPDVPMVMPCGALASDHVTACGAVTATENDSGLPACPFTVIGVTTGACVWVLVVAAVSSDVTLGVPRPDG
ncbi:hypothetical protein ACJBUE_09425 [Ralstonia syzygii subsp. celebesensis]|uniref:hypothetical protein n=1 Tax=Ralstonia syzygii TaxID=28097 RepID=UPI001F225EF8|nr:hypothetical protein [Ralstonia syzygii]